MSCPTPTDIQCLTPPPEPQRKRPLTKKQADFTRLVGNGVLPTVAARVAGYSTPKQSAYDLTHRTPNVVKALYQQRTATIQTELAPLAMSKLRELITSGPPPVAYSASRYVLELAGHRVEDKPDPATKPLSEMSLAELEEETRRVDEAINAALDGLKRAKAAADAESAGDQALNGDSA